ncbi:MAG: citrate/2-methylcitrate synthase, partial [Phycisphaerales bacterium]
MSATAELKSSGLEGMIAGKTAICAVNQTSLIYRGYEIADLAANATFEEVAFLLLIGHKPSQSELKAFSTELASQRAIPGAVTDYLKTAGPWLKSGAAVPMDVLRTAVSMLGNIDPRSQEVSPEADLEKAKTLTAQIPTIIGHMQNVIDGRAIVKPDESLSHAANLLYMITGSKPSDEHARVIDVSLILYAEHDYNASTFASRVISATLSDIHGAVTGAIAALKGPLHGGANEMAMEMLREIRKDIGTENDPKKVQDWMHQAFADKRKLMGFGHRVYKNGDSRVPTMKKYAEVMAEVVGDKRWMNTSA